MAGLSPFTVMSNILSLKSAISVKTFRENSHDTFQSQFFKKIETRCSSRSDITLFLVAHRVAFLV